MAGFSGGLRRHAHPGPIPASTPATPNASPARIGSTARIGLRPGSGQGHPPRLPPGPHHLRGIPPVPDGGVDDLPGEGFKPRAAVVRHGEHSVERRGYAQPGLRGEHALGLLDDGARGERPPDTASNVARPRLAHLEDRDRSDISERLHDLALLVDEASRRGEEYVDRSDDEPAPPQWARLNGLITGGRRLRAEQRPAGDDLLRRGARGTGASVERVDARSLASLEFVQRAG